MSQNPLYGIVNPLVTWYRENKRNLPWRKNREPYRVWISEIMLQQTRSEAVIGYYERFLNTFPDVYALANAPQETLMKTWEGLGYYRRATNMKSAAHVIVTQYGGNFPKTFEELLSLPGVGMYTAGAVASICFGVPVPAVDGNVLRVVSRLLCLEEDVTKQSTKDKMFKLLKEIYPTNNPGDFTEGLMELGAVICIPNGMPKCEYCPLSAHCLSYIKRCQLSFPVKSPKKSKTSQKRTVFLLLSGEKIAIKKRVEEGLLWGLWEFPNVKGALSKSDAVSLLDAWGILPLSIQPFIQHTHVFTHISWEMDSFLVVCDDTATKNTGFYWAAKKEIRSKLALPSAFKPFFNALDE